MYSNYQNPSYYRANPFSKDGYMPPIAHKNRKQQDFFSQIPQGQQYLDPKTKKHFKGKAYESQIQHSGIFSTPQKYPHENDIARDRGYFRSLNTIDIQGASPNTIISMGVKNKLKAQQQLKRRQRQKYQQQVSSQNKMQPQAYWMSHHKSEDQKRRQYILNQLKKKSIASQQPTFASRINYHNRQETKKLTNNKQEVEEQNRFQQKRMAQQISNQYEKQLQPNIKYQQLEQKRKLQQRRIENRKIQPIKQYDRIQPITNLPPQQYQNLHKKQRQPYLRRQHNERQQLAGRSQSFNNIQTIARRPQQYQTIQNQNFIQHKQMENRQNLKAKLQRDIIQKQQSNLQQNNQKAYLYSNQQRQKQYNPQYQLSYDKYAQPKYHPHPSDQSMDMFHYYSKDQIAQKQSKKIDPFEYQILNNKYLQYNNKSFGSRQEHRKNNPTNLSYGIPSFSMAGKNVVGY